MCSNRDLNPNRDLVPITALYATVRFQRVPQRFVNRRPESRQTRISSRARLCRWENQRMLSSYCILVAGVSQTLRR